MTYLKVYGKTHIFSDFSEVWVFQRWTMVCNTCNTWFCVIVSLSNTLLFRNKQDKRDNCAMTGVRAPGLTNTNSLRVLNGLKSTARFTNRSFQLHITLWLDRNAISCTILIQFAVTGDFLHCLSSLFSESSDSLGEASSRKLFLTQLLLLLSL